MCSWFCVVLLVADKLPIDWSDLLLAGANRRAFQVSQDLQAQLSESRKVASASERELSNFKTRHMLDLTKLQNEVSTLRWDFPQRIPDTDQTHGICIHAERSENCQRFQGEENLRESNLTPKLVIRWFRFTCNRWSVMNEKYCHTKVFIDQEHFKTNESNVTGLQRFPAAIP